MLVLERGMLPYGASTRNAGFACIGSPSELLSDLENDSEDNVFALVERRWQGLRQLRILVGDRRMEYEPLGGFEIFSPNDQEVFEKCLDAIPAFNSQLFRITGEKETYCIADEKISGFGFSNVSHIIQNSGEGQLDTGKMMHALLGIARSSGVEILNGAEVRTIDDGDNVSVRIGDSFNRGQAGFNIEAKRLLVCVNGFAKKFLPDADVNPARAQVLITHPIPNLKIKGSFHYDSGYYYFRNVGDRVLIGGGRNLDFKAEQTEAFGVTELIQAKLSEMLSNIIIPGCAYKTEMTWSGIMGLGDTKSPVIKKTGQNVYCAVRMGGMGIAIGTLAGAEAAELILQSLQAG